MKTSVSSYRQKTKKVEKTKRLSSQIVTTKQPLLQKAPRNQSRGLSGAQIRELEIRLKGLLVELKTAVEERGESFNVAAYTESLIKGDDAEVAEKQRANNAALQELEILKTRLRLVQRALAKISAGVYGLCEETEEPIGYERLTVVPWARFAVHVQEIKERKLKDYKVSRLRAEA